MNNLFVVIILVIYHAEIKWNVIKKFPRRDCVIKRNEHIVVRAGQKGGNVDCFLTEFHMDRVLLWCVT